MTSGNGKLLFIGVDGMIPATVLAFVREGALPNISRLIQRGAWFNNCLPAFPTITPTCWASYATGATPATHGVTCQDIHLPGMPLAEKTFVYRSEHCLAERYWEAAARIGKRSLIVDYPTSGPARSELVTQVNGTGCTTINYNNKGGKGKQGCFGVGARLFATNDLKSKIEWLAATTPASGQWQGPRNADAPQAVGSSARVLARLHVVPEDSFWDVEPFDWYVELTDTGLILREALDAAPVAVIDSGMWNPIRERSITVNHKPHQFRYRVKVMESNAQARSFRIFFSPLADFRPAISPAAFGDDLMQIQGLGTFSDHAGFFGSGTLDDDTYLEIEKMNLDWLAAAIETGWRRNACDATIAYTVMVDTINHVYGNIIEGIEGTEAERTKCINMERRAYQLVDEFVGRLVGQVDPGTLVILASDHGRVGNETLFRPAKVLKKAGLLVTRELADGKGEEIVWEKTRAVNIGSVHIYVNLKGREPNGIVEPADYKATVDEIISACHNYRDEKTNMRGVAVAVCNEDSALLGLGGDRTGDVVWGVAGRMGGYYGGVHACQIPTTSTATGDIRAMLIMAGANVRRGVCLQTNVRPWDVAPTICHVMKWPNPMQLEGRVIYEAISE